MSKVIKVLFCPVDGKMEYRDIEDCLESYYELLGCETIDMLDVGDGLSMVIDDEGRLNNREINPHFYPFAVDNFKFGICGDFMIVRVDDKGSNATLNQEDLSQLSKMFEVEADEGYMDLIKGCIKKEREFHNKHPEATAPRVIPIDASFWGFGESDE